MSYAIDIYRRKLEPTKDLIAFAAFVSFFPQLVAGPIERASKLLPQISKRRRFDAEDAVSGMRLILWGMFKKVAVADTCGHYADAILTGEQVMPAPMMWLGIVLFSFQIYGDFSGYSDIAIGTARLFGIRLMTNFRTPYFARDIAEFWRRWHISLSTWFRDYLYIPLGGSRVGQAKAVRNTFIIFLVSGFWHGANWTFVIWGFIHACLFLPLLLSGRNRRHTDNGRAPGWRDLPAMAMTFGLVSFAWIFFRAESLRHAWHIIKVSTVGQMRIPVPFWEVVSAAGWLIAMLILGEWLLLRRRKAWPVVAWLPAMHLLTFIILRHADSSTPAFIYFQF